MELLPLQQLLAECSWCLSLGVYEDWILIKLRASDLALPSLNKKPEESPLAHRGDLEVGSGITFGQYSSLMWCPGWAWSQWGTQPCCPQLVLGQSCPGTSPRPLLCKFSPTLVCSIVWAVAYWPSAVPERFCRLRKPCEYRPLLWLINVLFPDLSSSAGFFCRDHAL